jgi:hypothetical protein
MDLNKQHKTRLKKFANTLTHFEVSSNMYEKTACHNLLKFIFGEYLHMYKTLQLFTSSLTENRNIYKYRQTYLQLQELLQMPSLLRLGLIKSVHEI